MSAAITAAMETAPPKADLGYRPRGWRHGWGAMPWKQATSLMIHLAGLGPRRVYRSERTGRYFIRANKRVRYLEAHEMRTVLRLSRREEEI